MKHVRIQLIDVIGSVMERPHVRQELCKKYHRILDLLEEEMKVSNVRPQFSIP